MYVPQLYDFAKVIQIDLLTKNFQCAASCMRKFIALQAESISILTEKHVENGR